MRAVAVAELEFVGGPTTSADKGGGSTNGGATGVARRGGACREGERGKEPVNNTRRSRGPYTIPLKFLHSKEMSLEKALELFDNSSKSSSAKMDRN
jgi:hypothetical protein